MNNNRLLQQPKFQIDLWYLSVAYLYNIYYSNIVKYEPAKVLIGTHPQKFNSFTLHITNSGTKYPPPPHGFSSSLRALCTISYNTVRHSHQSTPDLSSNALFYVHSEPWTGLPCVSCVGFFLRSFTKGTQKNQNICIWNVVLFPIQTLPVSGYGFNL